MNFTKLQQLRLSTVFLEFPVSVVQGTYRSCLQPSLNTVEMEGMVADAPSNSAFLARSGCLIRLALNTEIHDVVSANGTVINDNIPSPERNGIPLLDLEFLLFGAFAVCAVCTFGCVAHFDVRHAVCCAIVYYDRSFFVK